MKTTWIVALALLATGVAHAEDPPMGFYLGGGIGQATVELEDENSYKDFKGDDTGYKLFAGYRILPWVAVEATYSEYGEAEDVVFGFPLRSDFNAFSIEGVGMLPLGPCDLFLKGGIARWEGVLADADFPESRVREDNFDATFGLGAQFRAGQVALRAEAQALALGFDDDDDDEADGDDFVTFVSVGISWTF